MLSSTALLALVLLVSVILASIAISRSIIIAQPDQWLLCIRNGKLVRAGIGICVWRRPGDVVARFTSTVQRVSFTVDALSTEHLRVSVQGFILWSVSADDEGPFRAFQKLGLVNLDAPPGDLKSSKHLLSPPQHRAFQQLLGAAVQRLAATKSLEDLLLRQEAVVTALRSQLAALQEEMGIQVDQIEILQVRPADQDFLRQLSAQVEERVREEAANIRLEADERAKRRAIASQARIAEEQAEVRRRELEREQQIRLAEVAQQRELALAAEAKRMDVARAALQREELELAAHLDRIRKQARANGDAISAVASAEEKKSQGVREYELRRLVAEKVGDAIKQLPLHDARWITIGQESPARSLAGLIAAVQELTATKSTGQKGAV
jgi:hypothetical protein